MRVKKELSLIKWLRFITTKTLNGNQHTVKTITTVTIILIICKNRGEEGQSYNKSQERVGLYIHLVVEGSFKKLVHCHLLLAIW